jgi:hypothetical protein
MLKPIYPCIIFAVVYAVCAACAHTRHTYPSSWHCIVDPVICVLILHYVQRRHSFSFTTISNANSLYFSYLKENKHYFIQLPICQYSKGRVAQ